MYLYSHTSFQKQPHDNRPKIPTKNTVDLARTKWRRLLQCVWVTWPLLCGVDRCKQLCRPSSSYGWKRVNRRTKKKPDACIGGGGGGVFAGMMMVAWISSVNQWCLGFHWVISPMTTSIGVLIIDPLDLTVWFTIFLGVKTQLVVAPMSSKRRFIFFGYCLGDFCWIIWNHLQHDHTFLLVGFQ